SFTSRFVGSRLRYAGSWPFCCGHVESVLEDPKAVIPDPIGEHDLRSVWARIQENYPVHLRRTSTQQLRRTAFRRHAADRVTGSPAGKQQPARAARPTRAHPDGRHRQSGRLASRRGKNYDRHDAAWRWCAWYYAESRHQQTATVARKLKAPHLIRIHAIDL